MKPSRATGCLAVVAILVGVVSLGLGEVQLSPQAVWRGLTGESATAEAIIVRDIRLPRVLLGLAAGFALGMAGAALQGLLRNPLADPGVLGISASAGLGAVVALYYGLTSWSFIALPVSAMLGAAAATGVLLALARRGSTVLTLILVGIGISGLAVALTSLAINLAPNPFLVSDIVLWLLGSLANRDWGDLFLALPFIAVGCLLFLFAGKSLRALSLGEEVAASMGAGVESARVPVVLGCALAVGATVAVCGAVGFVGLVVPHLVRPLVAHDPARLLVPAGLAGGALLTFADTITRVAPTTQSIRLGVVTALVGTPFFIYLVLHHRRQMQ